MKKIEVNNYLDLSNEIAISSTTMKTMEHLLCLVILSNIQAQIKHKDKNLGKISISKTNLSLFFKKDILRKAPFVKLIGDLQDNHCFHLRDDSLLGDFFLSLEYDGKILDIEYDVDKIKRILVNKRNFTQIDIEYMCHNLTMSRNAIIMYILICYSKKIGKLAIKKETLIHVLLKDHKSDYSTRTLTRDIKNALNIFKDIIGEYEISVDDNGYKITFDKFEFVKKKQERRKKEEELDFL